MGSGQVRHPRVISCNFLESQFPARVGNQLSTEVQESFPQNMITGLILVGYFDLHVMCRKLALCWKFSYKMFSWYKFEHYCLYFEHVQEIFLQNAGNSPTHKCKMLHKCRKISYTYCKNLDFLVKCRKHVSYTSTSKYRCTQPLIFIFFISFGTCLGLLVHTHQQLGCQCTLKVRHKYP